MKYYLLRAKEIHIGDVIDEIYPIGIIQAESLNNACVTAETLLSNSFDCATYRKEIHSESFNDDACYFIHPNGDIVYFLTSIADLTALDELTDDIFC